MPNGCLRRLKFQLDLQFIIVIVLYKMNTIISTDMKLFNFLNIIHNDSNYFPGNNEDIIILFLTFPTFLPDGICVNNEGGIKYQVFVF